MLTEVERFWAKVDVRGPDECWPWLAATTKRGRGRFRRSRPHGLISAHRMVFILTHGREPQVVARHTCDNPICCNPTHIIEGSYADNSADMKRRGRSRTKLTSSDVAAIRAATGSSNSVAEKFGVSGRHVRQLRQGVRRIEGKEPR